LEWWPWWAIALIGLFAGLSWKAFRPRPPSNDVNDDDRRWTPGDIHSDFSIEPGESGFPHGESRLRLPEVEKSVSLSSGKSHCPNPLPLRETIDE
jgi:hypothetical protein